LHKQAREVAKATSKLFVPVAADRICGPDMAGHAFGGSEPGEARLPDDAATVRLAKQSPRVPPDPRYADRESGCRAIRAVKSTGNFPIKKRAAEAALSRHGYGFLKTVPSLPYEVYYGLEHSVAGFD
jgi:hypothetical protein